MNKIVFFKKYNINDSDFDKSNLVWEDLCKIHSDYIAEINSFNATGEFIANTLMKIKDVHSVRFRVKDPEHLIEKIIRKKIENPERIININNYQDQITDLIGIRVLHLLKESWLSLNDFITKQWDLKETPIAYIRNGDSDSYKSIFSKNGCEIKEHKFGYRSVHYIVESKPSKKLFFAEVQVRTIFEEGWSEIDHEIRYPYDINNPVFGQYLMILNRLAGGADEMGSFIHMLKSFIKDKEEIIKNQNAKINDLSNKVEKSKLEKLEKAELLKELELLRNPFKDVPITYVYDNDPMNTFGPEDDPC